MTKKMTIESGDKTMAKEKKYLTRDEILNIDDTQFVDVEVPEWGGTVRIKELTAAEHDELAIMTTKEVNGQKEYDNSHIRSQMVAMVTVDEEGKRLFNTADVKTLLKKNSKAIVRIFSEANRLNSIQLSEIEEAAKN